MVTKDDLPPINIKETFQSIKTLTSTSAFLRDFLVNILAQENAMKIEGVSSLVVQNEEMLRIADAVVNKWLDEFEGDELDLQFSNN